jgi:thymidylate kinase
MFTVALIGPDGAGKSTIGRQLIDKLPLPVKYVYMGVNLDSSNLVLPTTRLLLEVKRVRGGRPNMAGPPDPTRVRPRPKSALKRVAAELRTGLRLANLMAEEWFRQVLVWYYHRRGYIVLCDRHFFVDYYAYDVAGNDPGRPLANRLHGLILRRFYPRPDLIICLDAPAEVLFARKGEGTPELLERRRQEYLQLRQVAPHFVIVDATQTEEEVVRLVTGLIADFYRLRTEQGMKIRDTYWKGEVP